MKKRNIVKSKDDFTRIINKKNGSVNKYFIINKETNNDLIPKNKLSNLSILLNTCVMPLIGINLSVKLNLL